jgi:hypothetical protein
LGVAAVPFWLAAPLAAAGLTIWAVAGAGGWLVSAPGTPEVPDVALLASLLCLLRTAAVSRVWLGL